MSICEQSVGIVQHFMFTDKSGRSIVIEQNQKMDFTVYENHVGVMTNNPEFSWHMTTLINYVGMSDSDVTDIDIGSTIIKSSGKRSVLINISGDYSSASRFVRTATLCRFSDKVDDKSAINTLFHLLSTVDIVTGTIKLEGDNDNWQYTQYIIVYDIGHRRLYIKLYNNINLQYADFCTLVAIIKKEKCYSALNEQQYEKFIKLTTNNI